MQQAASNYSNEWRQEIQEQPELSRQQITTTTRKFNQHRKIMVKCGLGLFAYAVLLVFLCSNSAGLGYEIEGLNKDIQSLESDNHRMEYLIAQGSSLSRVEKIASSQLGMQKAEMNNSLAMEMKPEPVKVAGKSTNNASNELSQKPLHKIYNSLVHLAQNSL